MLVFDGLSFENLSSNKIFMRICKKQKGFTLIELMISVAIISILAAITIASLSGSNQKARTAKRVSDLNRIALALQMYSENNGGKYPIGANGTYSSECQVWGGLSAKDVIPGLVPNYLPSFPSDPSMDKTANTSCYLYISSPTGDFYALLDHDVRDPGFSYASQPSLLDPTRDSGPNTCVVDGSGFWAWKVYSPGGKCW